MNVSARSYLTAGAAALSAAAIVMAPVQPLNSDLAAAGHKSVSDLAVGLAAAVTPVDPIQNIIDVIAASGANLEALLNNWAGGVYVDGAFPFPPNTGTGIAGNGNLGNRTGGYASGVGLPILGQVLSNLLIYLGELPAIGAIASQVFSNIGNALRAPFEAGVELTGRLPGAAFILGTLQFNQNVNGTEFVNVPGVGVLAQREIASLLPVLLPEATYAALDPILEFATTPISGLLVGAIGPVVAPVLAVVNGISNAVALLQESDIGGALTELINLPTNAIGALLNGGQILDLTGLFDRLGLELPSTVQSIGLQMGGLLSPGGVALDALAADAELLGVNVNDPGLPVGPIGALAGLANYVAKSIVVPTPAPAQIAAATVDASVPAVESGSASTPEVAAVEVAAVEVSAPAEVSAPVSEPANDVADAAADTTPAAPRAVNRGGRGGEAASAASTGTSTPTRAARGAASRG